jgi:hypothetical protein
MYDADHIGVEPSGLPLYALGIWVVVKVRSVTKKGAFSGIY